MAALTHWLSRVTSAVIVLLLTSLTAATTLQVASRYITQRPMLWTEDVARAAFVWMVFLASSLGVKNKDHFLVEWVVDKFPPRLRAVVAFLGHLCVAAVAVLFIFVGYEFTQMGLRRIMYSTGWPVAYVYASIPVSGALMLVYLIEQTPAFLRALVGREELATRSLDDEVQAELEQVGVSVGDSQ